jgi:exodeoxyribonuclease VII small subunit
MPQTKNSKLPDFEKSLAELEKIVERMERGEQTLDDTLKDFERGMALSEKCQLSLDQAQQKVEKLVKKHGSYKLEVLGSEHHEEETDEDDH